VKNPNADPAFTITLFLQRPPTRPIRTWCGCISLISNCIWSWKRDHRNGTVQQPMNRCLFCVKTIFPDRSTGGKWWWKQYLFFCHNYGIAIRGADGELEIKTGSSVIEKPPSDGSSPSSIQMVTADNVRCNFLCIASRPTQVLNNSRWTFCPLYIIYRCLVKPAKKDDCEAGVTSYSGCFPSIQHYKSSFNYDVGPLYYTRELSKGQVLGEVSFFAGKLYN
jgi:hypothetical protein